MAFWINIYGCQWCPRMTIRVLNLAIPTVFMPYYTIISIDYNRYLTFFFLTFVVLGWSDSEVSFVSPHTGWDVSNHEQNPWVGLRMYWCSQDFQDVGEHPLEKSLGSFPISSQIYFHSVLYLTYNVFTILFDQLFS